MFITSLHYIVRPGRFDRALETFTTEVFPMLESESGFMRVLFTGDADTGKGIVHTLWQTQEAAERCESSGEAATLFAPFVACLDQPPEISGYPVIFDREF